MLRSSSCGAPQGIKVVDEIIHGMVLRDRLSGCPREPYPHGIVCHETNDRVPKALGILYEDSAYLRDHGAWQREYMHYLGLIIGGGTSQIQKNIISERGLGMPREPKVKA